MHLNNAIVLMKFEWFEKIWTDREFWKVREKLIKWDEFDFECNEKKLIIKTNTYLIFRTIYFSLFHFYFSNYFLNNASRNNIFVLIWFEFIHSYDINLSSTHERNYDIYIEWTKLFEKENCSLTIQRLQHRQDNEFWNYVLRMNL